MSAAKGGVLNIRSDPDSLIRLINHLICRQELSPAQVSDLFETVLTKEQDEVRVVAALVALRAKGETGAELAAAAKYLRDQMVRITLDRHDILDTCGTGGDGASTFNISTATALVAAAAGVPVVKHGNRAISSRSGSADVLGALGVAFETDPDHAVACLEQIGIAFCFAPRFHPILNHVAQVRRRLGLRTIFNVIGPLLNPANASYQLIGVGHHELLDPMAEALATLGTKHSFLVCGHDGLDEVTLTGPTLVREVKGGQITVQAWNPDDFSLPICSISDLHASGPEESALQIKSIFEGRTGPRFDMVLANSAAALLVAGRVSSLKNGVVFAREIVTTGKALEVLQRLILFSQSSNSTRATL